VPSYSPVFSSQFISYTDAAPNTSFDVPTGFTAVVRDITAYATLAATELLVQYGNGEDAPLVSFAQLTLGGISAYAQWTGRVVVPAGGTIELDAGSLVSGLEIYVGGYLLRNTLS